MGYFEAGEDHLGLVAVLGAPVVRAVVLVAT